MSVVATLVVANLRRKVCFTLPKLYAKEGLDERGVYLNYEFVNYLSADRQANYELHIKNSQLEIRNS